MHRLCHRLLLAVAITLLPSAGLLAAEDPSEAPVAKQMRLVIDFGDGVEKHFTAIAWKDGMTVMDVLVAARKHPRGIKFEHRGDGETAFLTQIDDLKNEGRGRNWVYRVNDQLADRSFAVFPVKQSDTILWSFGEYR